MRNDFIGTSIDGDARAACNCRNSGSNAACCGSRQPRTCGCENNNNRQTRECGCEGNAWTACDRDCNSTRSNHDRCCDNNNRQGRGNDCDKCDKYDKCDKHDDYARQSRHDGCSDHDNDCARQNRSNGNACGCENDYTRKNYTNNSCSCNGRTPAMVYAQHHDLDSIYGCERALIRGTLFGCLDKPMCHEKCNDTPCFTQCQADKFTIWELRLYLNTHPCDQKALALLRKLTEQMDDDCGCTFDSDCNRWSWPDGPWPWEYQRCCGKEA